MCSRNSRIMKLKDQICFKIPTDVKTVLEVHSEELGLSVSDVVRIAIKEFIAKQTPLFLANKRVANNNNNRKFLTEQKGKK